MATALLLAAAPISAQTYCPSDGGSGNTFNIQRVQYAGIDNTSGDNNGYGDFTALSATVTPGTSNTIALDGNGLFFLQRRYRVWVDWDRNGVFAGSELAFQGSGFGQVNGSIAVPANAPAGPTRMRISMSSLIYQGPCASFSLGEVEDYTVIVTADCVADAGTLTTQKPEVCFDAGGTFVSGEAATNPVVPAGYQVLYVLTEGPGLVIQAVNGDSEFQVNTPGNYTIHTLVYDPATLDLSIVQFGVTTGFDVNGLLIQGGGSICAALDVAGVQVSVIAPDAGTLSGGTSLCSNGGAPVTLTATPNGDANVPAGYQTVYVLTQGAGLTILNAGPNPSFDVTDDGLYTIHTLVYDPATLDLSIVQLGVTTGFDVNGLLVQGGGSICASLDVPGAQFNVASPNAGTLSGGASICGDGNAVTLTATPNGDANVPAGYQTVYVLTQGAGLTIVNAGPNPSFDVTDDGLYTIHTLVYDPATLDLSIVQLGVTTGFDVNGLLVQGGGSICASLDVPGAQFNVASPSAGTLSGGASICGDGNAVTLTATPNGDANVPAGYQTVYVLTQGAGLTIVNAGPNPSFDVTDDGLYTIHTLVYDPATLDLSIVQLGVTTGFDVNGLLVQGGGSICASLDVPGAQFNVASPNAGTLSGGASICGDGNAVTLTATPNGDANVPAGYQTVYVLTQGAGLTIVNAGPNPSFDVTDDGLYTIHTLVYDPATLDLSIVQLGVTTGFDVNGLLVQGGGSICASLDVPGAQFNVASPNAGTLSGGASICGDGNAVTLTATPNGDANVPAGYQTVYVLTQGAGLTIVNAGPNPSFDVTDDGLYTIHTLVYDPATLDLSIVQLGVTTGFDVNGLLVQGGGSICASLDVPGAQFNVASPSAGTLSGGASICGDGNAVTLTATPNGDANVPAGYQTVYVLTQGAGLTIVNAGPNPSFDVTDDGLYTIHTLVYDPATLDLSIVQLGVTTGFDVNGLLVQGGGSICASLDVPGAQFNVASPNAGTLSGGASICGDGNAVTLTATPNGDANVPAGYQTVYVLTQGAGLTIVNAGPNPSFDVTDDGLYTIHTLVYDPATLDLSIVQLGVTTGFDVNGLLVQGGGSICASLDVPGAQFNVASPNAGTLSGGASICGDGNAVTLTATPNGDANVPAGYQTVYVLTQGAGLTIVNAGPNPSFDVTDDGLYTIHTLVYDPATLDLSIVQLGVTTGFDVNGLLVQGGGSICASLDVPGAQFTVGTPSAGTLTADAEEVCFEQGTVMISATPNGDANVPAGYQTIYVLTQGAGLVIQNVNTVPEFEVSALGTYTIHTLVYDPATLDLSIVQLGVTTGFDVNGLLVQGGGSICASLDVSGAVTTAVECPLGCDADAGTLSGGASICGDGNAVTLTATPNGDANVPAGYQTVYVLTQDAGLTIVNAGANPSFDVTADGLYTIHTLVYDPATLDLSIVQLGVTTGFDVNGLLVQGGGSICASLDVPGAQFNVASPNAGTLTAVSTEVCLENGVATLSATANGDANVPAGYQTVYVLTQDAGLTIVNAGVNPSFDVTADGLYTIHTLVYDPATLDLSIVQLGVTTGFDVNGLLVQGGGSICASLDVPGAAFNVSVCTDECLADAGTIAPEDFIECRVGGSATLVGLPGGDAVVPAGYQTLYVLTRGTGLTIQQVSATPVFTVQQLGLYRIHTLVYDPATLDLSIVQLGVTTGFDVNGLLIQGGGSICASLDVTGAPHLVVGPFLCAILNGVFGVDQDGTQSLVLSDGRVVDEELVKAIEQDMPLADLNLWPNPARDVLNIELNTYAEARVEMSVINILGQEAIPALAVNAGKGETRTTIDVAGLVPGQYILRLTIGDGVITQRFTKVD